MAITKGINTVGDGSNGYPISRMRIYKDWVSLTDEEILADDVLRYHFGLNGGAGPVSKKGKAIIEAIEEKLKDKNGL
tara:strand:+ start:679 stop:909 length:231 start_codon:yes stop_codon:yes gene_type:complete